MKLILSIAIYSLFVAVVGCTQSSDPDFANNGPKIIEINAPEVIVLPQTSFISCEVQNTDSLDLQYNWEATSGTLINPDSSVVGFHTPSVESEVMLTCTISDTNKIIDQKSVNIFIEHPAFIGKYVLDKIHSCDSTYDLQTDPTPELLFEIHDSLVTVWEFKYSWQILNPQGLSVPDSCLFFTLRSSHDGKATRVGLYEDNIIQLSRAFGQGYFSIHFPWQTNANKLILGRHDQSYEFIRKD